jgi:hypothetical protein
MGDAMNEMWKDFDDFELACICADYGFEDRLEISDILPVKLANREEIEALLTEAEHDFAFHVDINCELV